MQSINETNFENNTDIKQFMASSNPTVDMIVKAYIARDTVMNISFDKQKNLISISCYQMTKAFKKKIADNFFNQHSIRVEKDGYWYFIVFTYGSLLLTLRKAPTPMPRIRSPCCPMKKTSFWKR